ncbi:hypothetical protein ACLOJK_034090 [Asimina triloba]
MQISAEQSGRTAYWTMSTMRRADRAETPTIGGETAVGRCCQNANGFLASRRTVMADARWIWPGAAERRADRSGLRTDGLRAHDRCLSLLPIDLPADGFPDVDDRRMDAENEHEP